MTKKNQTKRALISSVIALMLCFSMLVGTTFAWFTDSVSSAKNTIVAGNLDVELEYATAFKNGTVETWTSVDNKADLFDPDALWEPGHAEVVYLRVSNLGSLSLKYQLRVNVFNETPGVNAEGEAIYLSKYLVFDVVEMNDALTVYANREAAIEATEGKTAGLNNYNGDVKALDASGKGHDVDYVALIVYMPETVGNEANYVGENAPTIELGVDLFATQEASEEDSFGPNYDYSAPILSIPVALPENPVAGKTTTFTSSTNSEVKVEANDTFIAALKDSDVTSASLASTDPIVDSTAKKVTVPSLELVDQNGDVIDLTDNTIPVTVTIPVGDAFEEGELVEIYHDDVIVASAKVSNKKVTYSVTHFCEVTIDASNADFAKNTDGKWVINSVADFIAFASQVNGGKNFAGETVVLNADIDLKNMNWTPIGTSSNTFKGTFDGQNHTVKNLAVYGYNNYVGLFGYTTDGAVKNLTVENAKVSGRVGVGVVAGCPYTSTYSNITVKGHVEVNGMAYVGGVGGRNAYANWDNITVDVDATSYVKANSVENNTAYRTYVGGVVGFNGEGGHTFSNITSNIDVIGSTCDIGGAFGIAHYNNKFENVTVTGKVSCVAATLEIGGIAGVWHNENGTSVTFTNCEYNGESNVNVVGSAYSASGAGKLIIDDKEVIASAYALQAALNAATGNTTIDLNYNIAGDVIVTQKAGVNVVINGNGNKYYGTIYIHGQARHDGAETLTIKNINFIATEVEKDFISSNSTGSTERYAHNVTVENCTFTGAGSFGSVGMRYRQAYNMQVINCTATNLHSLMQTTGGVGVTVSGTTVENCKNGMSFGTTDKVTVTNNNIESVGDYGYGIRVDASGAYTAAISDNTISADACVLFRKATGAYTATLTNNEMTADVYTVIATDVDYEDGTTLTAATGALNITIDGATAVNNGDSLKAALAEGKNVILLSDVEMESATTAPYGNKYAVKMDGGILDGQGNELYMECYGDDYGIMTSGGTIKNLTVKEGCRAVMIMYPTSDIILDNVNLGGNGVLYPINTGEAGAEGIKLTVTNSTLAGWTSFGDLIESASFTNVEFKQGTYYNNIYGRVFKPYVNTTLTNCTFVEHMNLDLSSLAEGQKVTFTNCTVNGQAITADVFTVPTADADYDTELFTVDLPSWATSVNDCIVFAD